MNFALKDVQTYATMTWDSEGGKTDVFLMSKKYFSSVKVNIFLKGRS